MSENSKKSGAIRVMTNVGPVWCHYSQERETIKLRRYVNGEIYDINSEKEEVNLEDDTFIPTTDYKDKNGKNFPFTDIEFWKKKLTELSQKDANDCKSIKEKTDPIIIPITQLRMFYEVLQKGLLDTQTQKDLAKSFSDHPESLENLWDKSRETFKSYKNPQGWSDADRKDLPPAPTDLENVSNTNEFVAYSLIEGNTPEGYSYVDRELSPRRTTNAVFSNKLSGRSSGSGGMDLLLKSKDGLPVIGEVKVKKDANAFYGLIQAMTYAVECSTSNQLARIKKYYKTAFNDLDLETAAVEIAIFKVNSDKDETFEPVRKLIKKLNENKNCAGLKKIVLLKNDKEDWAMYE